MMLNHETQVMVSFNHLQFNIFFKATQDPLNKLREFLIWVSLVIESIAD